MKDKDHADFRHLDITREQDIMSSMIFESINELKTIYRQYLYQFWKILI